MEDKSSKYKTEFNGVLSVLLWIFIIINGLSFVYGLFKFNDNMVSLQIVTLLFNLSMAVGSILFLDVKKAGFWIIVIANVVAALYTLFGYQQINESLSAFNMGMQKGSFLISIFRIALILLLMLIKKDGKNAYQVLWPQKEDSHD